MKSTILSGCQSQVLYKDVNIKARSWTLNIEREKKDVTCSNRFKKKYTTGKRRTSGRISLFYDNENTEAIELVNQVNQDNAGTSVKLDLYSNKGTPDPFYNNVEFLVDVNSSDTEIIDKSKNSATIVTSGILDIIQDGIDFNGTSYFYTPTSAAKTPNQGDFTVECFFTPRNVSSLQAILGQWSGGNWLLRGRVNSYFRINAYLYTDLYGPTQILPNVRYHLAMTRSGNVWRVWLDGNLEIERTESRDVSTASYFWVGARSASNGTTQPLEYFDGIINYVRVTNGIVRYTEPFDVENNVVYQQGKFTTVQALITKATKTVSVGQAHLVSLDYTVTGPISGTF